MQPDLKRKVVKNASANLIRLAGSGIIALVLPPFLVRMLPRETYATWALLLQLTAYLAYLDFGIQTAVARFVAHTDELNDTDQRNRIVSTSLLLLSLAAVFGCAVVAVLTWQLPHLFRQMPASLYGPARLALAFMGVSFALGLPVSAIHALFVGFQKNEVPVVLSIANKVAMALLVGVVVVKHRGLGAMGAAVAVANLLSYVGAYAALRSWASDVKVRISHLSKAVARQIAGYSSSVVVWMLAMLMISGLDLSIVAFFDYRSTAYYAIALTLTTFVAQAQGAIFAALLPASAVLGARADARQLGNLLVSSTRYGMLLLLAAAVPLVFAGHYVIRIWAGPDYAQHGTLILQVLVIANVIRLSALPYSTLLLGTGQQNKVIISPLAEGFTNLVASVAGAYFIGAVGVALGTLVGSFVSIGMHLFYNMPRTAMIIIDRARLIKEALLRPALCILPFSLLLFLRFIDPILASQARLSLSTLATIGSGLLFWNYGLIGLERRKLAHALRLL